MVGMSDLVINALIVGMVILCVLMWTPWIRSLWGRRFVGTEVAGAAEPEPATSIPDVPSLARTAADAEERRRWRALLLLLKAKIEVIMAGDSTVEREFLAHVMLPNGVTMEDWSRDQLCRVYADGSMPPLLPGGVS